MSEHTRNVWHQFFTPKPLDDKSIEGIFVRTKIAVDEIRARGGDVVFVRPPSAPDLRVVEDSIPPCQGMGCLAPTLTQKVFTMTILPPRRTSLCRKALISPAPAPLCLPTRTYAVWLARQRCCTLYPTRRHGSPPGTVFNLP